jgi:hypothetical protein
MRIYGRVAFDLGIDKDVDIVVGFHLKTSFIIVLYGMAGLERPCVPPPYHHLVAVPPQSIPENNPGFVVDTSGRREYS